MKTSYFKVMYSALCAAFSTFSSIPVPKFKWEEKNSALMLPLFPIVGLVIGILWYFANVVLVMLNMPIMLKTAIFCVIPIILTGFFHMDGFMDVADAVLSRQDVDRKREILKDSHVGSFAVLGAVLYFMFYFSVGFSILSVPRNEGFLSIFAFIPVFSRSMCSIFLLGLPLMSKNGYAAMYRENARKNQIVWLSFCVVATLALCTILLGLVGALVLIFGFVVGSAVWLLVCKSLKGVNGDVSGCALVITELACIISLAILI